jgi:hypothetical protein
MTRLVNNNANEKILFFMKQFSFAMEIYCRLLYYLERVISNFYGAVNV